MGFNWEKAMKVGLTGLGNVAYKQAENAWDEEKKASDFMRQVNLEMLRSANTEALQNDQQSFLMNMEKERRSHELGKMPTKYQTKEGIPVTAGMYAQMGEEERAGLLENTDIELDKAQKVALATVDIESIAKEQKSVLESKQEYNILKKGGSIPENQTFEDWYQQKQYNTLFSAQGVPDELYKQWSSDAKDLWKEMPTNDPEGYDRAVMAAKGDSTVAGMAYIDKYVKTMAGNYKGTKPTKGGQGLLASQQITSREEKQAQMEQWAKTAPYKDVFDAYKKSNPKLGDEQILAMIFEETGRKPTDAENAPKATATEPVDEKDPFILFKGWTPEARKKRREEPVDTILGF